MKKKPKTPHELEIHEAEKLQRKETGMESTIFKNKMKNICIQRGVHAAKIQLQFAKDNPQQMPTSIYLSEKQILACYETAINEYIELNSGQ